MLFVKSESFIINIIVFLTVVLANGLGVIAKKKPIKNVFFHSLHHIFFFLVILTTIISIIYSLNKNSISFAHILVLALMIILPFVKKGKTIHIGIGGLSLFCSTIPIISEYFN